MKVFALGGYGKVGLPANKLLAQTDLVTEIAIVGRNLELAEKAATVIGEKAIAIQADGTDEQKLTSLMEGYDLIVNAADNDFVLPSIRAAIHNNAHYCDVAFGDILEQALQLAPGAKAVDISAIVANGVHPSITNLMGVHVARQLQEVEQLQLGDASMYDFQRGRDLTPRQWLEEPRQSLAALHEFTGGIAWMLHIVQESGTKTVLDYQDGQWVDLDPIRCGLDVPLPQDGTIISYPYLSSDPLFGSLPRDLARVSPVEMLFSPLPPQLHDVLRELSLSVLEGSIDADAALDSLLNTAESDPHRYLTLPDDFVLVPKTWARAVGRKDGRAARFSCWLTRSMWDVGGYFLTSVALVVAVRKILRGEIRERGVMTAEKTFEPQSFFDEVVAVLPEPPSNGKLIGESFEWLE
jgi:saccharopine dehydrogenase-like NADP-dependent oxidoreductase